MNTHLCRIICVAVVTLLQFQRGYAQRIELVPQKKHTDYVVAMDISSTGILASGGFDSQILLWDLKSGLLIRTLYDVSVITSLKFTSDGHHLFSKVGNPVTGISKWDVATGKVVASYRVTDVFPFPEYTFFTYDDGLELKDEDNRHRFQSPGSAITAVELNKDRSVIALGYADGSAELRSFPSFQIVKKFQDRTTAIRRICFAGDQIVYHAWNDLQISIREPHTSQVRSIKLADDTFTIESAGLPFSWYTVASTLEEAFKKLLGSQDTAFIGEFIFRPEQNDLIIRHGTNRISVYNLTTKKIIKTFRLPDFISKIIMGTDNSQVLYAASNADKEFNLIKVDMKDGQIITALGAHAPTPHYNLTLFGKDYGLYSTDITELGKWKGFTKQPAFDGYLRNLHDGIYRLHWTNLRKDIYAEWNFKNGLKKNLSIKTISTNVLLDSLGDINYDEMFLDYIPEKHWYVKSKATSSFNSSRQTLNQYTVTDFGKRSTFLSVTAADFKVAAQGRYAAMIRDSSVLEIHNLETGQLMMKVQHTDAFSFSPEGRSIALTQTDSLKPFLKVIDLNGMKELVHARIPGLAANELFFGNTGKFLVMPLLEDIVSRFNEFENFEEGEKMDVSSSDLGSIAAFDLSANTWLPKKHYHDAMITGVSFSFDDRFVLLNCEDGISKLYEFQSDSLIYALVNYEEGDIFQAGNFYYSPKRNYDKIAFRLNNRAYPFEQFDLQLNRPDAVLKAMPSPDAGLIKQYESAYRTRLKKMKVSEQQVTLDIHLPVVNVREKTSDSAGHIALFNVDASDDLHKLDRLMVRVNQVPVSGLQGISLKAKDVMKTTMDVEVPLSEGVNRIQFSVINEQGVESLRETVEVISRNVAPSRIFYVGIGISKYQDAAYNLQFADNDARELGKALRTSPYNVSEKLILNQEATRTNILSLKTWLEQTTVNDIVILLYSGHGLLDSQSAFYFCPTDINIADLPHSAVSIDEMEQLLDGIPARKKIMLIDACHSGDVDPETDLNIENGSNEKGEKRIGNVIFSTPKTFSPVGEIQKTSGSLDLMKELFADLSFGSGTFVLSSSSGLKLSWEDDELKNGFFTYSIVKGLESPKMPADLNHDGKVSVSELSKFVISQVTTLTAQAQMPAFRRENIAFDFIIK
jgi:WD40 repeat protein